MVGISEIGDWRLPDTTFLNIFELPAKRNDGPLAIANPIPREGRITFDEQKHEYTIDGKIAPRSVTGLLHAYAPSFEPARVILNMRASPRWDEHREQFEAAGIETQRDEDIIAHWRLNGEIARARGTLLHYHAEQIANGRTVEQPHSPELIQSIRILQELDERGWKPYRTEVNIFHCGLKCAGQPDLLCMNEKGHILILDWKRTAKFQFDMSAASFEYPLSHLPTTPYWQYALQCNTYRFMLETEYGLNVDSMWLGVVHPAIPIPRLIELPRMSQEIEALLQYEIECGRASPSADLDAEFVHDSCMEKKL